ncbi:MAG TPA: hypothetical protein VEI52_03205 [Terriglobales bacterium]|nr:hypothetical protein [Terriglobales bacterium]
MHALAVSLVIQLALAFGLAGLLWPDKLIPVFDLLLFPWPASHRTIRSSSVAAIVLSVLLFLSLLPGSH